MSFVHFFQQTVEPANAQAQGQVQTSQVPAVAISPQGIQSRNLNINFFLNCLFTVFSNKQYNFYNKKCEKCHVNPVYGATIRTHDLWNPIAIRPGLPPWIQTFVHLFFISFESTLPSIVFEPASFDCQPTQSTV